MAPKQDEAPKPGENTAPAPGGKREVFVHSLPYRDENGDPLTETYWLARLHIDGKHARDFFGDTRRKVVLAVKTYVNAPDEPTGPERIEL